MLPALLLALVPLLAGPQAPDAAGEAADLVAGLAARDLHAQVEREARAFLQRWPRHERADEVRYRLGAALEERGQAADALALLEPLAADEGFAFAREASFRAGRLRARQGDARGAAGAFDALLARGAGYLEDETRLACARARLALGEHERARAALAPLLEGRADAAAGEALLLAAWSALRAGRNEEASALVERAAGCAEGATRAALAAEVGAEAALALGEPRRALDALAALPEAQRGAAHERARGYALAALGRHAEARTAFERALALAPPPELVRELGLARATEALLAGDARGALAALAERGAEDARGLLVGARAHDAAGEIEPALECLERARRLEPDGPSAAEREALRGDLLFRSGRREEAGAAWLASDDPRGRVNAAALELGAQRPRRALELAEAAWSARERAGSELAPADAAEAARVCGESELALEHPERALAWLERALAASAKARLDPAALRSLRTRAAWARLQAGDAGRAAAELAELARDARGEEAAELGCLAGRAFAAAGQRAEARLWLERALAAGGARADEARLALVELLPGEEAVPYLEQLASGGSEQAARARLELASRACAAGELERAQSLYARVRGEAREAKVQRAAGHGLAWCAWKQGRAGEAARLARELVAEAPQASDDEALAAAELWLAAAAAQGDAPDTIEAVTALARAARPERWLEPALGAARALGERGERAGASALLALLDGASRAAEVAGDAQNSSEGVAARALRARLLVERAFLAFDDERARAQAFGWIDEALRLAPAEESVLEGAYFAAEAARAAGEHERARAWYARAEGVPRLAAHARLGAARCALETGDARGAERALASLLAAGPERALAADARWARARALAELGERAERAAELERLLADAPPAELREAARLALGEERLALGSPRDALAPLEALLRETKDAGLRTRAELARGEALLALGELRGARAAFARVAEQESGAARARARLGLGRVARAEGHAEEALGALLEVAVLHEGEAALDALLEAGELLLAQGERAGAEGRWRELLERGPDTPQARAARERLDALAEENASDPKTMERKDVR